MPTQVDTLYTDLELRTAEFGPQVKAANASLDQITRRLDQEIPHASTVASRAVSTWAQGLKRDSDETIRRAIDRTIYKFEELGAQIDITDKKAVAAFRNQATAAEGAIRRLNANSEQIAGMGAAISAVDTRISRAAGIDRLVDKYVTLAKTINLSDQAAVQGFQRQAGALGQYISRVGGSTSQANALAAALERVTAGAAKAGAAAGKGGAELAAMGTRGQRATLAVASGIETMARTGQEGIGALKGGISQIEFMLGPSGALAGALIFAAGAVFEYFRSAREESEKTKRKILDDLRDEFLARRREREPVSAARSDLAVAEADIKRINEQIERQLLGQKLANIAARDNVEVNAKLYNELGAAQQARLGALERIRDAEKGLADEEASRLGQLIQNQQATAAEQTRANELLAQYRAELAQTTAMDRESQEKRIALLGRINAITGETAKSRAKDAASEVKSDEQLAQAKRDLVLQFEDLNAKARTGQVSLTEYAQRVRDLGNNGKDLVVRLRLAKEETGDFEAALASLIKDSAGLTVSLEQLKVAELAQDFAKLQASMTLTGVDDLQADLGALERQIAGMRLKGPIDEDAASRMIELQQQLIRAKSEEEALDERIRTILRGKISVFHAQIELQLELSRLKREELLVLGEDEKALQRKAQLQALIAKLEAEIARLKGQSGQQAQAEVAHAASLADLLSQAANAAYGIATGIAGADASITKMIGASAAIANNFRDIAKLANDAGGFAKLFSTGAGVASALPAIGGIIGGLGALGVFGKNDPDAQRRRQEHQENLAALRAIQKNTGDLLGVQASGRDLAGIEKALEKVVPEWVKAIDRAPGSRGREATSLFGSKSILEELQKATGLSAEQLKTIAKSLRVTLNDTVASYEAFLQALHDADLEAFTKGFSGAIRRLEIEARLDPKAFEGLSGVIARIKVLLDKKDGAPAIIAAIGDLKLDTVEGRAAAIERLMSLVRNVGSLSKDDLGGLGLSEFIEEVLKAVEGLRAAQPIARTAAEQFTDALEAWALAVEFGTLTVEQQLEKAKLLFQQLFPELAASIDFSSAEAFKASLAKIIDGFSADGVLTEAEKAQKAILLQLAEAFGAATTGAVKFTDALDSLEDAWEILGTGAVERFNQLAEQLGKDSPELKSLTEGLDVNTAEGRDELKRRAARLLAQLQEGGVTEDEQKIIDMIKRLLGAAKDVAEEASSAADKADREAEERRRKDLERRKKILADAERQIELDDVTDPIEIQKRRIKAFQEAFGDLIELPENWENMTAAEMDQWIRDMVARLEKLGIAGDGAGLPIEDIIEALLGLERGADSAKQSVESLADKLSTAFDNVEFDLELEGVTDPLERLIRTAQAAGSADFKIRNALRGLDLRSASGRAAAEAALIALGKATKDTATRDAISKLLDQIRDLKQDLAPLPEDGTSPADQPSDDISKSGVSLGTERSQQKIIDLNEAAFRQRAVMLRLLQGIHDQWVPGLTPPALPAGYGTGVPPGASVAGGRTYEINAPLIINGPITATDGRQFVREAGQQQRDELRRLLDELLGDEVRAFRQFRGEA